MNHTLRTGAECAEWTKLIRPMLSKFGEDFNYEADTKYILDNT